MTNEQLAMEIQRGNLDYIPALWEQMRKLIALHARKYYNQYSGRCTSAGITLEDLEQDGYFALLEAIEAYNPADGYKFNTYLRYPLRNRFNMIAGFRTAKGRNDPLTQYTSIDTPLAEGEATLGDLIDDPAAQDGFEQVLVDDYILSLHQALDDTMQCLIVEQQNIVKARFYEGLTLTQIGERSGVSFQWVRQLEVKAFRKLRHPAFNKPIQPYRDDVIETHAYHGIGLTNFNHDFTSSVEWTVFALEQRTL